MGLFGDLLGSASGAGLGELNTKVNESISYQTSGQYNNDKRLGQERSKNMSDAALYKAMKDNRRSAGERVAYSEEIKNRKESRNNN